ncbi:M23 family metallopeptidase [Leucobacter chromiisoli]|uniref:M23 family metallopeptidase n=1 Tax=Leucobacter chromiisoli TaxID=2796471 RepID=UPI0027DE00F3|nr:M23 family metallopeptidase [Leucobacter chromiisoli]
MPEAPRLPSRRSLREGTTRDAARAAEPGTADPFQLSADAGAYLRLPLRTFTPDADDADAEPAVSAPAPRRRAGRARRAATASAALASAGGLVLTLALPVTAGFELESAPAALHQQNLALEAVEGSSFEALNAVEVADSVTPGTFSNIAGAEVQYPFAQPVQLTDPFGYRTAPVEGFHDAQDFAAAAGTPIQAIADGVVLEAGYSSDGCGFGLKLQHEIDGMDVQSRYCHMQDASNTLQEGDAVEVAETVGRVGNTGMSFGAHLHLVIKIDGEAVDPMPFLQKYNRITR